MPRILVLALAAAFVVLTGCAGYYGLVETDAALVTDCDFVGTFAETSNPGREDGGVLKHYVDTTGVKQRVMQRAVMAGATHLVWMHTYSVAAAAQAYRCPGSQPLTVVKSTPVGIVSEDFQ